MEMYVGLDVHSKRSVFVIEAADGRVVARGDIATTPAGLRQWRRQHELAAERPSPSRPAPSRSTPRGSWRGSGCDPW